MEEKLLERASNEDCLVKNVDHRWVFWKEEFCVDLVKAGGGEDVVWEDVFHLVGKKMTQQEAVMVIVEVLLRQKNLLMILMLLLLSFVLH